MKDMEISIFLNITDQLQLSAHGAGLGCLNWKELVASKQMKLELLEYDPLAF